MASNFTHAIVRKPSRSVIDGLTGSPELGKPDYKLALEQHDNYTEALKQAGVEVTILPALEEYPDSVFVEDTAVITPKGVVSDLPGTTSRHDEAKLTLPTLREFFDESQIKQITEPGTLEGGDVMMVDDHYYVGRSKRTNDEGFRQFTAFLADWGMTTEQVPVEHILHLKTGGTYVEDGNLLVSGEFKTASAYRRGQFKNIFEVPDEEAYGADCVRINDKIIMAAGYPQVEAQLKAWGYDIIAVEMSEFRKIDGSITCLSLRW
ncbi:N-dimethylarginine dimethylaminohydrolase [Atopobium minutum]|uniref:Dimethylargininase n=1 Tax=Atopobium minutum TaxID=1381 RepID=A0AB38A738_9ACTN|nr:arginine deiminase-related protein [Atopobium minutum]KRN56108.1 N-dimethylarginine dimethylaminohydrolase [Atopobium minutum]SEB80182.1 dimethylargininase [Atopobium minutum]